MANPQLICPAPRSTPGAGGRQCTPECAIPPDVLREASRRLGIMSLLGAVLWLLGTTFGHLAARASGSYPTPWYTLERADGIAAICIALSLALFAYTRRSAREPDFILDLGLGYLVLMAFGIGVMTHIEAPPPGWFITPQISWIGVVVLIFAAIVPNAPRKMSVAVLIAVSMNPLAMVVARASGVWDFGPWSNVIVMHYPDYLLAGVAVVISQVVTRLGQQVTRARELGSYELGELLGRGGMGVVYRATHRMLARPAAIKLIRPEALSGSENDAQLAVRRFRREAEAGGGGGGPPPRGG
jgi:serine/threonine-protein kinase